MSWTISNTNTKSQFSFSFKLNNNVISIDEVHFSLNKRKDINKFKKCLLNDQTYTYQYPPYLCNIEQVPYHEWWCYVPSSLQSSIGYFEYHYSEEQPEIKYYMDQTTINRILTALN